MKLFLVSQDINDNYDTYDSMVVCAEDEPSARTMNPSWLKYYIRDDKWWYTNSYWAECEVSYFGDDWVSPSDIDKLTVTYIGEADKSVERWVVLGSYNAW